MAFRAWIRLAKPRNTAFLLSISLGVFFLGQRGHGSFPWPRLFETAVVVVSLAAGIFAVNQYIERRNDALMDRTKGRPLPSGLLDPQRVLILGLLCTTFAVVFALAAVNPIVSAVAAFVAAVYLLIYTPLKYRTVFHTLLGALPGAAPPLIGWAAATGELGTEAWILALIVFFWQIPHFLAIEILYRDDYRRAGIKILPLSDTSGRLTRIELISSVILMIAASMSLVAGGLAGPVYGVLAALLGAAMLTLSLFAAVGRSDERVKRLFYATLAYLPLLFAGLLIAP